MPRHLLIVTCLLLSLTLSTFAAAEIYKTVDKQGRVVYTDQPPPNTSPTVVELPSINSLPPTEFLPNQGLAPSAQVQDIGYQVSIMSPASGTVLQADQRSVGVSVSLDQALQAGHKLLYFLDGTLVEKTTELSIKVTEPPRGEHKLHVEVASQYGKSLGQSAPVIFVVLRPIAPQPPPKKPLFGPHK
jgi:hypothetical protein